MLTTGDDAVDHGTPSPGAPPSDVILMGRFALYPLKSVPKSIKWSTMQHQIIVTLNVVHSQFEPPNCERFLLWWFLFKK